VQLLLCWVEIVSAHFFVRRNHGGQRLLPLPLPGAGRPPTEHADVVLTPWAIPLVLGLGAILLGGDWHLVPSSPCIFRVLW